MNNHENIHINGIIWTEQVVFRNICICIYIYTHICIHIYVLVTTINKNEFMNLKDNREGYIEGLGGKRGK